MKDESIELTVTDEVEDVWLTNGHRFEDHYAEKVEGPIPEWDWYYECKAEEEPCEPEPFVKARKGRRGWNQRRPHQTQRNHRQRMHHRQRRF